MVATRITDGTLLLRHPAARGRGVTIRAVELLRDHGVREIGLGRMEILPPPDNVASGRVTERAGFTATAERRLPDRCAGRGDSAHLVYRWSSAS